MLTQALDLLLPPLCAMCDAQVGAPGQLCAACFQSLSFIAEPACRCCGLPFAIPQGTLACANCQADPPPWHAARAALRYDAAAKRLILPLKHTDREDIARVLSLHMQRAGAALLARAELLVPVPLHRWRLWRRGYNQSVLLARALSRRVGVAVLPDGLVRRRATPSLGAYAAADRAALLAGAVTVRPTRCSRIAGRRVVLIDDVLTSGATARACTQALLDAGAANVDLLVASRVPDPRLGFDTV